MFTRLAQDLTAGLCYVTHIVFFFLIDEVFIPKQRDGIQDDTKYTGNHDGNWNPSQVEAPSVYLLFTLIPSTMV